MIRLLATTVLLATSTLTAANYLPLENGNSWTYRVAGTKMEFTIRVGTPILVNNHEYHSVTGFTDSRVFVRNAGDSLLMLDEDTGVEKILVSFEPFEGGWWNAHGHMCDTLGQTKLKRGSHNGPAGRIPNVLDVEYRTLGCADTGLLSEQYADNIGLLRRTVQSIAGPRKYDLVSARVGNVSVEGNANGRFTTAIENVSSDSIDVRLTIEASPAEPITLSFASGQEYDVAVRNADGKVVYLWSSTALFIQATHTRTITGRWTATVTLPKPMPGSYTVEGWMTTIRDEGRYAATVPLTIKPE